MAWSYPGAVHPFQTALAAAAAMVSLAFALSTWERWLERRRAHEAAWSAALLLFSLASLALGAGAAMGWNGVTFRAFYLFGAITNVPFLALGTVYLLAGRRVGDRVAVAVTLFAVFAAGVVLVAPFRAPIPVDRLPQGSDVFGALPRVLAVVGSAVSALVVFGGAAWSAWRLRRGRLMWANVLIAAGTAITGASGLLNSAMDEMEAFAVTLVAGIAVLFVGFLVATTATSRPRLQSVRDEAGGRAEATSARAGSADVPVAPEARLRRPS
jgi:hypothetical protein